jgi:hypothetical protein
MKERAFTPSDRPPAPFPVSCSAGAVRSELTTSLGRFAYRLAFVFARAAVGWAATRPARIPSCPAHALPPAPARRLAQPGAQGCSPLGTGPCDGLP